VTDNAAIFRRDMRCIRCGERPNTTQHRIHGNRKDRRSSNLISACMGPGTKDCHGFMEAERKVSAMNGWEVSKYDPDGGLVDTTLHPVYMPWGPLGPGWYSLDDDCGIALIFPQPPRPHLF